MNRVEVIILLIVAGVLATLMLPWLLQSREDARLVQCRENLRNIGIAVGEYVAANGRSFPYGTIVNESQPPEKRFAWTVPVAAYRKGDDAVLKVFDVSKAWDAPENLKPAGGNDEQNERYRRFTLFHCPADTNISPDGALIHSSYVGMGGLGPGAPALDSLTPQAGLWGFRRRTRLEQITDGSQYTICVIDTARRTGPWIAGGPPTIRPLLPERQPYLGKAGQFGGHHAEGSMILFADGRVKLFSENTDPQAFAPLCTPAGERGNP